MKNTNSPTLENYHIACTEISAELVRLHTIHKKASIPSLQNKFSQKYNLKKAPSISDILSALDPEHRHLRELYKIKPVRTASGVAVVAVMCKPHRCPHIALTGNICVYCPGGVDSDFEYSTQSYTGYEPTSMRAIRHRYDPYQQARTRINQLEELGHVVDKVEYIIMGGTFMSLSDQYKNWFVMNLHDSLSGSHSTTLAESVKRSEKSRVKCVGMTIETRPDFCTEKHLDRMLVYGCTRIEMGVQSVYEDVAFDTNRGHTVESVCDAFCLTKDAGYKIVSHMMPNLPNVCMERDYAQFIEFFENHKFRSDGLKIYPTLVIRGTGLYELWKNKRYKNYSPDELVDFLARILALVPPWTRIYRIQRDIPMPLVSSGVEHGNIREVALLRMKDYGTKCRDVRTREVGIKNIHEGILPEKIELIRRDYSANNGWETFLSYEDINQDILVGMLRLRKCSSNTFRKELMENENDSYKNYNGKEINSCIDSKCNENNSNSKDICCKNLNYKNNSQEDFNAKENNSYKEYNGEENNSYIDSNGKENNSHKDSNGKENNTNSKEICCKENNSHKDSNAKENNSYKDSNILENDSNCKENNSHKDSKNINKIQYDRINEIKLCNSKTIKANNTNSKTSENNICATKSSSTIENDFHRSQTIFKNQHIKISRSSIIRNNNVSVIRELHVYGSSVPVHQNDSNKYQHQGFGKLLIDEAERIARNEHKSKKIAIISGVGTRTYYKKFGYKLEGPYMIKYL